jgi:hypothetical protein
VDTGTSADSGTYTPNQVLSELRASRGWGRPRLARELHTYCLRQQWPSPGESNIGKQIYRLESGRIRSPDEFYTRLYCQFFGKTVHELFGGIRTPASTAGRYRMRSHKFVPVFVGPDAVNRICEQRDHSPAVDQWTECRRATVDDRHGLYTWRCGVVVFHIVEHLEPTTIAEIALWRRETYPQNIEWAQRRLAKDYGCHALGEPYVLSTYWVDETPHDEPRRNVALRLLSIPRVLTEREEHTPDDRESRRAHAELVEQALLRDGFDHPGIEDFGIKGISTAYASWSGVVYHPTAPSRGLTEADLVACELSMQAAWAYCDFIRREVEEGRDPVIAVEFGWRFIRGLASRLTAERPQETSQHRSMREAIINTSGLAKRLQQAIETVKEAAGGSYG